MRIVIKIGSNVLTRADGKLDVTRMSALVDQVAWLRQQGHEVILVSSGAVACGRRELKVNHSLDSVEQRQLFSALGQVKLVGLYYDLFREFHIHVGQVLTMKENFQPGEQFENQRACMRVMLENGVLPIVNENDTVCVTELMFTDNDELSGLIAQMMEADTLILLSNIDGIFTGHPDDPQSQLIRSVAPGTDLSAYIQSEKSAFGRGGMHSKYTTASKVQAAGIRVIIANGERENILCDLMQRPGETPHTEFKVEDSPPALPVREGAITLGEEKLLDSNHSAPSLTGRAGGESVARLSDAERNAILLDLAESTEAHTAELLAANALDLARMDKADPRYDRLQLTESRLRDIAADLRKVASLPSPLGRVLKHSILPNGLELTRVSVPFGVIGIIFEARPNVCFDCFALCLKAGSACVLKGGSDAKDSCTAIVGLIHEVLQRHGLPKETVLLLTSHEDTDRLLTAHGLVDLIIPRGSSRLINYVREHAQVPVIETGAGVVHCYIDRAADLQKAIPIVVNAKTRRVSVCNALDCLIIHRDRLADLPTICQPLFDKNVFIEADEDAYKPLQVIAPSLTGRAGGESSFGHEFLSLRMAVKVVDSLDEALDHIARYGSGHSESIVTEDPEAARRFLTEVDAACVYHNAPTSFTDGGQFGLGAEIGISTQKLHARGPMALEEITTYKWVIKGEGQTRP